MPENHEQIASGSNQAIGPIDAVLDAALAKYAAVEPRAGLEERLLANLRTGPEPVTGRAWWRWGLAGALAAIVIVAAALTWRGGRSAHLLMADHPTTAEQIRRAGKPPAATAGEHLFVNASARVPRKGGAIAVRRVAPRAQTIAQADPKLDVFPSPQPLSEEELALARYVRNFPSDAKLAAQEQAASENEVLAKMQALASKSTESN
ncbi:MAG: hypothetical protein ABSG34_13185 [Candidatus Sulfotelmatobacter sp.]